RRRPRNHNITIQDLKEQLLIGDWRSKSSHSKSVNSVHHRRSKREEDGEYLMSDEGEDHFLSDEGEDAFKDELVRIL
ncbi:hypothetical protein AVEN_248468-1, partial [Araneus ventricosus]